MIEKQVFRKLVAFKSKQLNKYVCFNPNTGYFILKNIQDIDKYCIFIYSTKSASNTFQFGIGTNRTISLSFNKYGKMINQNYTPKRKNQLECSNNKSNLLNVHTKLTDYVPNQDEDQYVPIFTNKNTNNNLKSYYQNNHKLLKHSLRSNYLTTSTITTKTKLTRQLIKRKKLSSPSPPPVVISLLKRNNNNNNNNNNDQSSNNTYNNNSNHIRKLNKKRLYNYNNNDSNYLSINHRHHNQQQRINNYRTIFN